MAQSQKITVVIAILLAVSFALLDILLFSRAAAPDRLEVVFLDVGQGDSILIKTPARQNILIDGGPDSSVIEQLGKYLPFYSRKIDLMILTHPHSDHVSGLIEVLRRYQVKRILYSGAAHTSPAYLTWLKEIKKEGAKLEIVDSPRDIHLADNLNLKIIYPSKSFLNQRVENLNNSSIVAKLVYKNSSFLFTGDIEKEAEEELIKSGLDLSADVLKVAHHGGKTSGTKEFLDKVNPKMAVISAGAGNPFGHPHYRTIRNLQKRAVRIFRTDKQGNIIMKSDGNDIRTIIEK